MSKYGKLVMESFLETYKGTANKAGKVWHKKLRRMFQESFVQ